MNKERWDEKHLEELFKQAPTVADHRAKDEILQRLIDDGAFNEESPQERKIAKKHIRWTPLITSIASLFILVLVGSQFINNSPILSENSINDEAKIEATSGSIEIEATESVQQRMMIESVSMDITAQQTLVYPSQLDGVTLFEMGLSDGSQIVPVSFLIPNEIVVDKTGVENPTKLQLYETFASAIDEKSLGFNEFNPFKGMFYEEGEVLIHNLPQGHGYDASPALIDEYTNALVDTFGDSYKEVQLERENGAKILSKQAEALSNPIQLQGDGRRFNYFAYQKQDGSYYLSSNIHMSYDNVTDALQSMSTAANDIYRTVILPDVTFSVKDEGERVKITFNEPLDLEQYDPIEGMRMIEGMLLTAASFDKQVQFDQIVQQSWNSFDFTQPLEKPIAANIVFYNF